MVSKVASAALAVAKVVDFSGHNEILLIALFAAAKTASSELYCFPFAFIQLIPAPVSVYP